MCQICPYDADTSHGSANLVSVCKTICVTSLLPSLTLPHEKNTCDASTFGFVFFLYLFAFWSRCDLVLLFDQDANVVPSSFAEGVCSHVWLSFATDSWFPDAFTTGSLRCWFDRICECCSSCWKCKSLALQNERCPCPDCNHWIYKVIFFQYIVGYFKHSTIVQRRYDLWRPNVCQPVCVLQEVHATWCMIVVSWFSVIKLFDLSKTIARKS